MILVTASMTTGRTEPSGLFAQPVEPAVALLKEFGEAGQHRGWERSSG